MSDTNDLPPAKRAKIDNNTQDAQNCQDSQNIGLHVTPEEVEKLREFQVLDEVKSDDEDSNDERSDKTDSSDELPEEEIEKMLEEDLPEDFKGVPKVKEKKYVKRQKIILEEKGINYFEVLPLDWMMVRHCSGMPIYMHRASRVCTLSKPYFLGKGNTRRHDIPISAIPCLAYRIALKEEQKQMEIDKKIAEQIKNGTWTDPSKPADAVLENGDIDMVDDSQSVSQVSKCKDETEDETEKPTCPFKKTLSELKQYGAGENTSIPPGESDKNFQSTDLRDSNNQNQLTSVSLSENEPNATLKDDNDQLHASMPDENGQNPHTPVLHDNELDYKQNLHTSVLHNNEHDENEHDENEQNLHTSVLHDNEHNIDQNLHTSVLHNIVDENEQNLHTSVIHNNEHDENEQKLHTSVLHNNEHDENGQNLHNSVLNPQSSGSGDHMEGPAARPVVLPGGQVMPPPRVETVSTSWKSQQLSAEELNAYCKRLFKFKEVHIMHFHRWADRRKYTKARKTMQYPTLPEGTKLITIPAQDSGDQNGGKSAKRDWVMNMNGCSYLSVFHEYVRRALHKQPVYEFKQLENATAPYQATVYIGGMQYGVGRGSSKRQAKSQAARASIHILIPEMRDELPTSPGDLKLSKDDPDFTFFDYVSIEDPRIQEFCGAAAEPSPHAILRTCLLRNFGAGDRHIHTEMKKLEFQKIELTMKVGKHSATVVCKNKKQAKQRASQHILQQLHPHITSWGSLLRLYGSRSVKSCKEKKLEEQQITLLQDKARHNEPNYAVLEKLRNEMTKLKERDNAVVPIGTLLVSEDLPTHSGSNLNNVDL